MTIRPPLPPAPPESPEISGEQQSDLMQLERLAAEGEAENPAAPGQVAPAPQGPPLDQEIAAMLKMVSGMVKPALPSVAAIYTPEVCDTIGATVAAVCNKHGWLQSGIGGKYGEEIMCLVVVGPIAWATVEATKTDIAARKAKPKEPAMIEKSDDIGTWKEPAAPSHDPGKTVRFG